LSYCILRMEKKKSTRDVVMTLQHNTRERMPPNADPEKTKLNQTYGGGSLEVMNRYHERLPEKVRKNAVLAVELVMTASPDFSGSWKEYLDACDKWALELFEGKKNLLHVAHHLDESTPHTHILFTPIKDEKLNAKFFIGGSRDRMSELQDDFYEKVGKKFGLERGKPREETRARHTPHTLAGKAAELESREAELGKKEAALGEREKKLEWKENFVNSAEKIVQKKMKDEIGAMGLNLLRSKEATRPEIERFWNDLAKKLPPFTLEVFEQARSDLKAERIRSVRTDERQNSIGTSRSR